MKQGFRMLVIAASLSMGASAAWAHAHLARAVPSAGAALHAAPAELRLWFTEALEGRLSELTVLDPAGQQVDKRDMHLDPADAKVMVVSLGALPAGSYTVVWKAVSVDSHTTHGDFLFTLASAS